MFLKCKYQQLKVLWIVCKRNCDKNQSLHKTIKINIQNHVLHGSANKLTLYEV